MAAFEVGVASPRVGEEIKFLDTSTGAIERAQWSFSDSASPVEITYQNDASRSIVHRFSVIGSKTVTLQVWGPGGQDKKQMVLNVTPTNLPPHAFFELAKNAGRGTLKTRFVNKSSGTIRRCVWNFGDGSPELAQESIEDVEHSFGPGSYAVTLTVFGTDEFTPSRYASEPITVKEPFPTFVRYLPWAVPSAIGVICLVPLALKRATRRRLLRDLSRLTGIVKCGPVGSPPCHWKEFPVNGASSAFCFSPPELLPPVALEEARSCVPVLSISKTVDPISLEESYAVDVIQQQETIETQSFRPDEDVFLQRTAYAFRYTP